MGGGGLHGDLELHHRFGQGRAAGYGEGQRGEQLVNSVSLSLSLSNRLTLSLSKLHGLGIWILCFVLIQGKGNDDFFFSKFFLFSFNSELKKNAKQCRFSGSNGSTNWAITESCIDKNWVIVSLLFSDEQLYHVYFTEEVNSWMITSAGLFLYLLQSFCTHSDCMSVMLRLLKH